MVLVWHTSGVFFALMFSTLHTTGDTTAYERW